MGIFKVIIEPSAKLDIAEVRAYYRALSAKVVKELNAEIDAVITQISKYPFAYSIRKDAVSADTT